MIIGSGMRRCPARSTLFPYTALFRSVLKKLPCWQNGKGAQPSMPHLSTCRSEEHTSELQSRLHLVCRLLLEKKNNTLPSINRTSQTMIDARNAHKLHFCMSRLHF